MISNINKGKIVIKKLIAFKILKGFRLNVTQFFLKSFRLNGIKEWLLWYN